MTLEEIKRLCRASKDGIIVAMFKRFESNTFGNNIFVREVFENIRSKGFSKVYLRMPGYEDMVEMRCRTEDGYSMPYYAESIKEHQYALLQPYITINLDVELLI